MRKWQKVRTKETIRPNQFYHIEVDDVISPSGKASTYSVIRLKPYSIIIPVDAEGRIHMVRQHRYPKDLVTIELPMGSTDGQDPLIGAKRELEEESGLKSDDWVELGRIQVANGISDSVGHLYLARNVIKVQVPTLDPADQDMIDGLVFTLEEARKMMVKGEIEDAGTICAFAKAEMLGFLEN